MTETTKEIAAEATDKSGQAKSSADTAPEARNMSIIEFAGLAAALSADNKKDPWLKNSD